MRDEAPVPRSLLLYAPVSGPILPVIDVPDPTFAQKMVGDGIAIDPTSEVLLAPCQGRVTQLHGAGHALTITSPEGIKILMHIGLETVRLKGRGFTAKVAEGDTVKPGTPLIAFDASYIAHNAASLLTLMVIANGDKVASHDPASGMAVAGETPVLELRLAASAHGASSGERNGGARGRRVSEPIVILNPAGLHARPAAVLVNSAKRFASDVRLVKDGREANAKSVVAILSLDIKQHDTITVAAEGKDAALALETLIPLIRSGLGENSRALPPRQTAPSPLAPPRSKDPRVLLGVAASPGVVSGQIFQLRHAEINVEEPGKGLEAENQRLLAAIAEARAALSVLRDAMRRRADADKAAIFAAHQELLEDPELIEGARRLMREGKSAAFAWRNSFTEQAANLAGLDNELLAGRANDIRDVGRRVLLHLAGSEQQRVVVPPKAILVARDLAPSDTASLDKTRVVGLCTTEGSATSHASILARSLMLPAVAGMEARALDIPNGVAAILDGDKGTLRLEPSEAEIAALHAKWEETAATRAALLAEAGRPATTLDGHRVKVVANIGGVAEAEEVPAFGGEGVGLLRSEFLFLQRASAPSEDEQAAMYAAIAKALGPERDLVVRTLDVGGDKPLAYMPLPPEPNPFLGVRGIRLNLLGTDLFRVQVRAILRAAPQVRLHIMFPMLSSVHELRDAKSIVLEEKEALGVTAPVRVGIMVEVPSAALLAEALAREADFFSIGTNDLTQYTLAMDRGHPRLAAMADALHPAVLRLMARTVEGAHARGKWVGVCGGLAGEVLAVPVLLGLGVDELSVSVSSIPSIKAAVRRQDLSACRALAAECLSMPAAAEVRARLASFGETTGRAGKEASHV
jgi:phosphocarrier protein FPr